MPMRLAVGLIQCIISVAIFGATVVLAYRSPVKLFGAMHDPFKATMVVVTACLFGALFACILVALRSSLKGKTK